MYLNKLKVGLNSFSNVERKIAIYIINNIAQLKEATTTSIANKLHIGESSITKFAKNSAPKDLLNLRLR